MKQALSLASRVAGISGMIICAISGLSRAAGFYYLAGFESMTVFIGGIGVLIAACYLNLEAAQTKPG